MTIQELDKALKLLGWSKNKLADKLGLHENTVYGWGKAGRPVPPPVDRYLTLVLELRRLWSLVRY